MLPLTPADYSSSGNETAELSREDFSAGKSEHPPDYLVLTGLDPVIHAFGRLKQRLGYAGQEDQKMLHARRIYPDSPAQKRGPGTARSGTGVTASASQGRR